MPPLRPHIINRALALFLGVVALLLQLGMTTAWGSELRPVTVTANQHEYDLAAYSQYLVDPNGALTIGQLLHPREEMGWRPVQGTTSSFGFSSAAYWLRFDILNSETTDADHFIEVHYPLLNEIEFYLVQRGTVLEVEKVGDKFPFAARPYACRNFLFKPQLPRGERVSVYLRVKSEGSLLIPVLLWPESDFYIHEQKEVFAHGLYFGVLFVFALYNLLLFLYTRGRATAYQTLYIICFGVLHASLFGFGYQYLWPEFPRVQHYSIPLFLLLSLFTALRFAHHFLALRKHCPNGVWVLWSISTLTLLLIVALPVISYSLAIQIGLLLVVSSASVMLLASFVVWRRIHGEAGYFFFAWVILLLTVITSAVDKFGWVVLGNITDHLVQVGVILQIGIFTLAQAKRMHEEREQRLTIQRQLAEDLASLVRERTEELEQANRCLEEMSHTDDLTGLNNRRRFDEELKRQFKAAVRSGSPISLAMLDIDHFKNLNDSYGHQVGDDYLRLIAAVIAAEVKRPMDSASRYGGEEFALILPDTPRSGAGTLAECIRSAVEALRHRVGEEWVPVTISIGTATLAPSRNDTPETLLQRADQALYEAKSQGRNRVVSG